MQKYLQICIYTLIFTVTALPDLMAQNWESANGAVTANTLNDVQFVTDQVVYAVGNVGTVIKSTDGGETWSDVSFGETRNFLSLHFFDENVGFVGGTFNTGTGGSSEMLAKTTNGGETWEIFSSHFDDFNDMEFLDDQTGWVASVDGKVLYTEDGGENWSSRSAGTEDLLDIHIQNENTFWVAGEYGSLYRSDNSGENWDLAVDIDTLGFQAYSDSFYGVEFLDDNTGFAVGQTYDGGHITFVLKTTDGGENWTRLMNNNFEYITNDIEIGDNNEIILTGGRKDFNETHGNAIYISEDEGESWKIVSDGSGPLQWNATDYIGEQFIAVGNTGAISQFTPSSDTLESGILTGLDIADVDFWDEDHGIIATGGRTQGALFTTTDGGETWQETLKLEGRKDFSSVNFAGQQIAWAIGSDHWTGDSKWLIYYSADSGESWMPIEVDLPVHEKTDEMQKVQFMDMQTGFIKAGKLIKTEDSGATWTELEMSGEYSISKFKSFQFIDENTGWLVGNDVIAATTDGGENWTIQYEQDSQSPEINELYFIDLSTGYVAMDRGNMMKTTDGGETWEDLPRYYHFDLYDLEFVTADSGFVVGRGGALLTTTDGGENFTSDFGKITHQNISSIEMLDSQKGWMAGSNGFFVSTNNGGGIATSIDEPLTQTVPSSIKLEQNYPNPFNPTTTIAYEVPTQSNVSLKVFNLLGQNVVTLVDNVSKAAGRYRVNFDAGNLASGIYLYRLNVAGQTISKQLTLIK